MEHISGQKRARDCLLRSSSEGLRALSCRLMVGLADRSCIPIRQACPTRLECRQPDLALIARRQQWEGRVLSLHSGRSFREMRQGQRCLHWAFVYRRRCTQSHELWKYWVSQWVLAGSWVYTSQFCNDSLSNWLRCSRHDADEAIQLPVRAVWRERRGVVNGVWHDERDSSRRGL